MRILLAALGMVCISIGAVCSETVNPPARFGQVSPSEFRQPLPEPPLYRTRPVPNASSLLSRLESSLQSAQFQIVGTEGTPRPQGQIGAQVYHLDGALTVRTPALELQPWNDLIFSGPEADIDGRGDFVMVGSAIYVRSNTFTEWQTTTVEDPYWGLFADINPALWEGSSSVRILGEASVDGSPTWVLLLTNRFGRQFKAWIREEDNYPLRYTASWINAKGATYYINALYRGFNSALEITTPEMLNRGIAQPGRAIALPSGSVTVTDVEFDCSGTSSRRPAPHDKFVMITFAFVDTGPGQVSISPDAWRLLWRWDQRRRANRHWKPWDSAQSDLEPRQSSVRHSGV